jgi:arginine/lysine/ornithine decarboxylase
MLVFVTTPTYFGRNRSLSGITDKYSENYKCFFPQWCQVYDKQMPLSSDKLVP